MLSLVVLYSLAQLMMTEQLHMVGMILLEDERMVLDNEKKHTVWSGDPRTI